MDKGKDARQAVLLEDFKKNPGMYPGPRTHLDKQRPSNQEKPISRRSFIEKAAVVGAGLVVGVAADQAKLIEKGAKKFGDAIDSAYTRSDLRPPPPGAKNASGEPIILKKPDSSSK